jgi:hypothetical protein
MARPDPLTGRESGLLIDCCSIGTIEARKAIGSADPR